MDKISIFIKREKEFDEILKDHNRNLGLLWNQLKSKAQANIENVNIVNDRRSATSTVSIPTVVSDQDQRLVAIRLDLEGPEGHRLKECFTWNLYGNVGFDP